MTMGDVMLLFNQDPWRGPFRLTTCVLCLIWHGSLLEEWEIFHHGDIYQLH